MTVEQQAAGRSAEFWLEMAIEAARSERVHQVPPSLSEKHLERAIKNLMIASHAR